MGLRDLIGTNHKSGGKQQRNAQNGRKQEKNPSPRERSHNESSQCRSDGGGKHDDKCAQSHGGTNSLLREYLQYQRKHHGQDQTRSEALHHPTQKQHRKVSGKATHKRANDKSTQGKESQLPHGKPFEQ